MQLQYGTLPSSHSRTPSDPIAAGYHTLSHTHKRSPSSDSSSGRSVIPLGKLKIIINIYITRENILICLEMTEILIDFRN